MESQSHLILVKPTQSFPQQLRYPLWVDSPDDKEGAILVSFQLIPEDEIDDYPVQDLEPETRECILEINTVGLRQMQPYLFMELQDCYMEFDVGNRAVQMLRTGSTASPDGVNPNHLETQRMVVQLPVDPLFAPTLNVRVFDRRFGGLVIAQVGAASIPLKYYLPWLDLSVRVAHNHIGKSKPTPTPTPTLTHSHSLLPFPSLFPSNTGPRNGSTPFGG
eukprot:TRINITY_DN9714_c0_g1_i1.p1 TRINITY_DN9714_c0_g1~~TRINITY_DN9714_c0_g1_i1.p1  ORF type:complete len:219 (+),score=52.58 TRINITY_DN9714_c0_g1_i1:328-984(+)